MSWETTPHPSVTIVFAQFQWLFWFFFIFSYEFSFLPRLNVLALRRQLLRNLQTSPYMHKTETLCARLDGRELVIVEESNAHFF